MSLSVGRFVSDRCLIGASALSYATLVSLVPLTALALVIFSGFEVFGDLRLRLLGLALENFAPGVGDQAAAWFSFAATNAAKSTAVGIASLVVTSILLFVTIEDQLHLIFHVKTPRLWTRRITTYWTILTFGPVLAGLGLMVTGGLDGVIKGIVPSGTAGESVVRHGSTAVRWLLPFMLETVLIAALLSLVPNCRVRWRDSFAGAAVSAALLQLLKMGFIFFVVELSSYSTVYGALAGIPIFLLWMYVFWIAVLLGAEITASLTRRAAALHPELWKPNSGREKC